MDGGEQYGSLGVLPRFRLARDRTSAQLVAKAKKCDTREGRARGEVYILVQERLLRVSRSSDHRAFLIHVTMRRDEEGEFSKMRCWKRSLSYRVTARYDVSMTDGNASL